MDVTDTFILAGNNKDYDYFTSNYLVQVKKRYLTGPYIGITMALNDMGLVSK